MRDSWDYIEARLAEQRTTAEQRRRVAQARSRNGSASRLGSLFRSRSRSDGELGGCKQ
jgi:hypothetical protein